MPDPKQFLLFAARNIVRIENLEQQIIKILNGNYPDDDSYWELIGNWLAVLNDRIQLIREGKV